MVHSRCLCHPTTLLPSPALAPHHRDRWSCPGSANQIEFIDMVVDYLTDRGIMDPGRLYESPFTDVDDQGVSGVFTPMEVKLLVDTLAQVKAKAAA
jgi:hypothetical protein